MPKKISACRTEVRVVYHCDWDHSCDFLERASGHGVCDYLRVDDHTCSNRAAQRAGRKAARQRGATAGAKNT